MQYHFSTIRERCLATFCYFDLFDYPLKFEELQKYFLGEQPTVDDLKNFLHEHRNLIHHQDGYYFLKGRDLIVVTRGEREKISAKYWKKVRFFLPFVQFVPFVRMVGICNTLAINNASSESDIDLFIVAKNGRLFFVRFLTVLLFGLLGVRRHGNKIARRFCLSFYVDESALNLEKIQDGSKDIYLPFWILTMKPLYGFETYRKFSESNDWIRKYFQRGLAQNQNFMRINFLRSFAWLKELLWKGKIGDTIEEKLRQIQLKRHHKHSRDLPADASVIVNDHMLKFHNVDRRKDISERFEQKLQEIF